MRVVTFNVDGVSKPVDVREVVIAGWTGRNRAAVERHVAELAAMGVRSPAVTPSFFQVGTELLTTAAQIDVVGHHSSGEVEFVLVSAADGLYVGVGSDHTDRKVEAYDFTVAKQMCPKPIAAELWSLAAVERRWDDLVLRSHVTRRGETLLYQHGSVNNILSPMDLVARWPGAAAGLAAGTVMFCGTLPVEGDIAGGEQFRVELIDPVGGRSLRHEYTIHCLSVAD